MNKREPQVIKDVLGTVLEQLRSKKPHPLAQLLQEWKKVAKGKIAAHTKPVAWKNKCLIVNVDSSGYLYELNLQREKILNKLKERLGKGKVSQLRFKIGAINGNEF